MKSFFLLSLLVAAASAFVAPANKAVGKIILAVKICNYVHWVSLMLGDVRGVILSVWPPSCALYSLVYRYCRI